jgi:hypothetical protein
MALTAREHGHPHAAHDIARDLLSLAGIRTKAKPAPQKPMNGSSTNGSSTMKIPSSKAVS